MSLVDVLPFEVLNRIGDLVLARSPFEYIRLSGVCKAFLRIVQENTLIYDGTVPGVSPFAATRRLLEKVETLEQIIGRISLGLTKPESTPKVIIYHTGESPLNALAMFNMFYMQRVTALNLHSTVIRVLSVKGVKAGVILDQLFTETGDVPTMFIDHTVFKSSQDEEDFIRRFKYDDLDVGVLLFDHHYHFQTLKDFDKIDVKWSFRKKPHSKAPRVGLTAPFLYSLPGLEVLHDEPRQLCHKMSFEDQTCTLLSNMNLPSVREFDTMPMTVSLTPYERFTNVKFIMFYEPSSIPMNEGYVPGNIPQGWATLPELRSLKMNTLAYGFDAPKLRRLELFLPAPFWKPPAKMKEGKLKLPNLKVFRCQFSYGTRETMDMMLQRFESSVWQRLEELELLDTIGTSPFESQLLPALFEKVSFPSLKTLVVSDDYSEPLPVSTGLKRRLPLTTPTINAPNLKEIEIGSTGYSYFYFILNPHNKPSFKNVQKLTACLDFRWAGMENPLDAIPQLDREMFPDLSKEMIELTESDVGLMGWDDIEA